MSTSKKESCYFNILEHKELKIIVGKSKSLFIQLDKNAYATGSSTPLCNRIMSRLGCCGAGEEVQSNCTLPHPSPQRLRVDSSRPWNWKSFQWLRTGCSQIDQPQYMQIHANITTVPGLVETLTNVIYDYYGITIYSYPNYVDKVMEF